MVIENVFLIILRNRDSTQNLYIQSMCLFCILGETRARTQNFRA